MCILCVLQFAGEMAVHGAASACGARQGEYTLDKSEAAPKGRDWRSLFCCCSRSGKLAAKGPMVFLHGVLNLVIEEAKDLPNLDNSWFRSEKNVSDPYITVDICIAGKKTCRIAKTSIIYNCLNPHWDEKFRIELCHEAESLLFAVKDMDLVTIENIGFVSIRAIDLASEEPLSGWFPVVSSNGTPSGSVKINAHFQSVASITRSHEVPDTVFPLREGCKVKLYQDAHTPALPPITDIPLSDGGKYEPPNLWIDISHHIKNAKEFIYIVGWSINTQTCLERGEEKCETFGSLLKRKADEGVRVLLLVWNEALSTDVYTPGVMGTHDEETRQYFEGTEVEVVLAARQKNKGKLLETSFVSTLYTHHQKCVLVDVPTEEDDKRRIVAFVGGLDITDGRWDTPEHLLFKSLPNDHKDDFYNACFSANANAGPRQPWHDVHAKLEGPVVNDILSNFIERWRKQAPDLEQRLLPISEEKFALDWTNDDDDSWNVQFLRSINSDSAHFNKTALHHLLTRKGRLYDNSIQRAYVHQIRRAQNYIYIENQYFLGSAHGWLVQEAKCPHLIPVELATRIISAIKAGQPFRVYVVLPLYPEGDPSSIAVQEILHWQHRTMEMMYRKISKALKKVGSDAHPTDYLSFFCLGKRESEEDVPDGLEMPESDSPASKARQHMRLMIYVHSKLAIFDDEYTILGSANINERSMSGNRDTEMAVGAYQKKFTKEDFPDGEIRGNVHNYRMALWAEHCGKSLEDHLNPSSLGCMRTMRKLAQENLNGFLSEAPAHNDSHLLLYPIEVTSNGRVNSLESCKHFPDTRASVLGKNSSFLPNTLTT